MWSEADRAQIAAQGTTVAEVERQLELFRHPPPPVDLVRACAVGDGIRVLSQRDLAEAPRASAEARRRGRLMKFVPASGAASRMFQTLLAAREEALDAAEAERRAAADDANARALLDCVSSLSRFAFAPELRLALQRSGLDLDALTASGDLAPVLEHLLGPRGLDCAALPKGLLMFHRYADGPRTPFEEHLVEAAGYVRAGDGTCRLHFTVSPEHESRFRALLQRVRPHYEQRFSSHFDVGFSTQKPSTNTIAADLDHSPFRSADGRLLFRPGGHGALIENLNDLAADVVFIKNIDNVVPEPLAELTLQWKQALGVVLLRLQTEIFRRLEVLSAEPSAEQIAAASRFAASELSLDVPTAEPRAFLLRALDRPLRVCGVVPNTGEPGGGPFWVRAADGRVSLQIVEGAQVDGNAPEQRAIFASSTHFNPVDIVCGLRDRHGKPFDLHRHIDESAVFISRKSSGGRDLQALERPGLWNGAMADWITVFVEVPIGTFNPVKTVLDLLRVEHQA